MSGVIGSQSYLHVWIKDDKHTAIYDGQMSTMYRGWYTMVRTLMQARSRITNLKLSGDITDRIIEIRTDRNNSLMTLLCPLPHRLISQLYIPMHPGLANLGDIN